MARGQTPSSKRSGQAPVSPGAAPAQKAQSKAEPTIDQLLIIWSKAVDTQMHFNEMSVKSRQLGLTFVAAALGVGVVLMANKDDFSVNFTILGWPLTIHVTVFIILAAILGILGVRQLDLNVYHRMLRGAVTFGEDFEEEYLRKRVFKLNKGMTEAISHFSRFSDAKTSGSPKQYTGTNRVTAEDKVRKFYSTIILFLVAIGIMLFVITNITNDSGKHKQSVELKIANE